MIINILRGSKNEKISSLGLDSLSVYGVMADSSVARVRAILDHLIAQGYLRVEEGEYPVVDSTPRSREILAGERPLTMMLPREAPRPRSAGTNRADPGRSLPQFIVTRVIGQQDVFPGPGEGGPAGEDEVLLTKLKELRRSLAQAGRVPAYIVFSDAALRDMCRKRPLTEAAFLSVAGVGEAKLRKYGEAFIRLIGEHRDEGG
jgi:ATP-dependent DNA helicase RecQ